MLEPRRLTTYLFFFLPYRQEVCYEDVYWIELAWNMVQLGVFPLSFAINFLFCKNFVISWIIIKREIEGVPWRHVEFEIHTALTED
jgi:hypothetical protein